MTAAELPGIPAPGFRVTAAELSNAAAFNAMHEAISQVVDAALAARRSLLDLGFAATHSLCVNLDRTAAQYTTMHEALRRQSAPPDVTNSFLPKRDAPRKENGEENASPPAN